MKRAVYVGVGHNDNSVVTELAFVKVFLYAASESGYHSFDFLVFENAVYLEEHPSETRELIMRCITAQRAREAARLAREETHRKGVLESTKLPNPSRCVPPSG